jgi:hypothetical protein
MCPSWAPDRPPDEEIDVGHADKPADTRAPETIENEIEATRERLGHTIDQLLYRSSPKTIAKREVDGFKAHFVDPVTGQPRKDNIVKVAAGVGGFIIVMLIVRKVAK